MMERAAVPADVGQWHKVPFLYDGSIQSGLNGSGTRLDLLPQNNPDRKVRLDVRAAWLHGCGVARLLARRTAVWQSQVWFPTWHPHGGLSPLSGTCDEETQRDFNEWRWMYAKNGKINKNINNKKSPVIQVQQIWWPIPPGFRILPCFLSRTSG